MPWWAWLLVGVAYACAGGFWYWNRRWWRRHEAWRAAHPIRVTTEQQRQDARFDAVIEMHERAAMDCAMCDEIGEPHVCARQWWRDRLAHYQGQSCSDTECPCHESLRLRQEASALWPVGCSRELIDLINEAGMTVDDVINDLDDGIGL